MTTSGKVHFIMAALIGALLVFKYKLPVESILFCVLGGMLPDADIRTSKMGRILPLWLIFKPHRKNITHSLLGALLFTSPILMFSHTYAVLFFIGYLSHLLLDCFNRTGVPLFYPNRRMYRVARIRSSGFGEWILLFVLYIVLLAIMSY